MTRIRVIQYEGDNSTFIWKHPCENFDSLTQLIVHESQEAVLVKNGQIATCYVDSEGNPTYEKYANPNGSNFAVEGITSIDGRILGKMGHSERIGDNLYKNIDGKFDMKLFEAGVSYFK